MIVFHKGERSCSRNQWKGSQAKMKKTWHLQITGRNPNQQVLWKALKTRVFYHFRMKRKMSDNYSPWCGMQLLQLLSYSSRQVWRANLIFQWSDHIVPGLDGTFAHYHCYYYAPHCSTTILTTTILSLTADCKILNRFLVSKETMVIMIIRTDDSFLNLSWG